MSATGDLRVTTFEPLPAPRELRDELPLGQGREDAVELARTSIDRVISGHDDRLVVVVGPCSVHDPVAALDYARRLAARAAELDGELLVVMRVYFEKPRSTGGWKGLINDPGLDGSHRVADGLRLARRTLVDVIDTGLAVGCEFLEPTSPQFIADAVAWGAIGARTTESQIHRQMASGLSMPVGFKNGMDGDVGVALDGCTVAAQEQVFFGVDADGRASVVSTTGNPSAHLILRGGKSGPNFDSASVATAAERSRAAGHAPRVVVDASHANSGKDHVRQAEVVELLAGQVAAGEPIGALMMESFIEPGRQDLGDDGPAGLVYGQSITDACIGWDETSRLLGVLADAVARRRATAG
ncbi:3-deoxy-7-phosphoheptulonate synthase [Mycetocola reblochoni]|nr:3-deoxy-7-phosphoheptulonate synthase [Mycetocola reblochoni]RLP68272.1 3-deoxy-7-phosphoheptulonate synthase [Mycetocola reblochoni]